jgi:hypothetical protein
MELKLKNNYMAKLAFLKNNPNLKHAGGQAADFGPARLKDNYPMDNCYKEPKVSMIPFVILILFL